MKYKHLSQRCRREFERCEMEYEFANRKHIQKGNRNRGGWAILSELLSYFSFVFEL